MNTVIKGLALFLVLATASSLVACRKEPPPPQPEEVPTPVGPPPAWQTQSRAGNAVVTATGKPPECNVTCDVKGVTVWTRASCLATSSDLRFVADDCSQFVALQDAPMVAPVLADTPVGITTGTQPGPVILRLGRLMAGLTFAKRAQSGRWVAWLSGTLGAAGARPATLEDGTGIVFETLDGVRHTLSFAELSQWADSGPSRGPAPTAGGLYQWEAADGSIHVTTYERIPKKARAQASLIEGEVFVIKGANAPPRPREFPPRGAVTFDSDVFRGAGSAPSCADAARAVASLEEELRRPPPQPMSCASELGGTAYVGGVAVYSGGANPIGHSQCMMSNEERAKAHAAARERTQAALDAARDRQRRVQVGGCI